MPSARWPTQRRPPSGFRCCSLAPHVVKAFNTAFAARQADPVVDGIQLDGFVAGDDGDAETAVLELVESVGFRPIDVGPLPMARTLEAMGWLNIQLQIRHGWPWQGGWKFAGPSGASRPTVSAGIQRA